MKSTFFCILAVCLLLGFGAPAFAQLVSDPNDRLYTDLELWMDRGLTGRLPPLRPYSVQLVLRVLKDVAARGTEDDQKLAGWYLARIDGPSNFHGVASSIGRAELTSRQGYLQLGLEGSLQGSVYPWMTYSARLGATALSNLTTSLLPEYQRSTLDYVSDNAVSSIRGLFPRMSMIGSGTVGSDSVYVQAGAIRGSYGPFWGDNAILSPLSPQSGQFSFVFHYEAMTGTMLLMDMSATDASGGSLNNGKFLSLGGLEFHPLDWLTIGVFDTVIWGKRFEPLYLLPVVTFYTQGMVGYPDNSFIGLTGGIKFADAVKADFILYVDDAAFNDLVRLNFNTMLLASLQVGVSWTPNLPFLTRLRITNLLITPYTYTHDPYGTDPVNYLNYTNAGQNIGPSLQPNSDRIEIEALLRPVSWVDLNVFGRFIIHGNASDGIPGLTPGDGSINDSGVTGTGTTYLPPYTLPPGYSYLRFLTQSMLEKTIQTGFTTKAYLDTSIGSIELSLSYTFEYILNAGLGSGTALNNYVSLGATFTY